RAGGQRQPANAGCQDCPARGEEIATVECGSDHMNSSGVPPEFNAVAANFQQWEAASATGRNNSLVNSADRRANVE
ncbi:MAG: hypothetical protein WCG92_07345, partial [Hyphomicrobiales bacterium]